MFEYRDCVYRNLWYKSPLNLARSSQLSREFVPNTKVTNSILNSKRYHTPRSDWFMRNKQPARGQSTRGIIARIRANPIKRANKEKNLNKSTPWRSLIDKPHSRESCRCGRGTRDDKSPTFVTRALYLVYLQSAEMDDGASCSTYRGMSAIARVDCFFFLIRVVQVRCCMRYRHAAKHVYICWTFVGWCLYSACEIIALVLLYGFIEQIESAVEKFFVCLCSVAWSDLT